MIPARLGPDYAACRRLNARHGRTYYLATLLLPPHKRPHVHALYGFARFADDIVDNPDGRDFGRWADRFLTDLDRGDSADPVCRAAIHTAQTWRIPRHTFEAFLDSMRQDLTVTGYPTYADLERYMYGSAAVIGLQMVPILEPLDPAAAGYARRLGEAFQLTNFLRDVAEDHHRGRVYLPQEDLDRFGVSRGDLRPQARTPGNVKALVGFEIDRCRELYARAAPGVELLHPSSRECIRTAATLYGGILDAIEQADHEVLGRRVAVPLTRRLAVALPAWLRARRSW